MALKLVRSKVAAMCSRAPIALVALVLLSLFGVLLAISELRSMALARNAILREGAIHAASARVAVAILECRRFEKDFLLNSSDADGQGRYVDKWQASWNELLAALTDLKAFMGSDDPRAATLAEESLGLCRQQFIEVVRRAERGESVSVEAASGMLAFYEEELQALFLAAAQIANESSLNVNNSGNAFVTATALNIGLILCLTIVPGALFIVGTCRFVGEMQDNELRLKAAFDCSFHPMIVTDMKGVIGSASRSVKSAFGWEPAEIVGKNVSILMEVPFRSVHDEKMANYFATGVDHLIGRPRELTALRRDGTTFPCVVTIWNAPLTGTNNYLLVGIIRDITEQRANEAHIAKLNQQVTDAARLAGKAEIATNVLHNVGNVLNSVNVASSLIRESLQSPCYQDVERVAELMETHASDLRAFMTEDARGRHLPQFLLGLLRQLCRHHDAMDEELLTLENAIDHIKAIVESQQKYAKGISSVIEPTDVSALIADAIRISEAAMARQGVTIQFYSQPVPMILLDKHKFLHVMVNLIGNAKHACMESNAAEKLVEIWVEQDSHDRVSVKIQDNGIGIEQDVMSKIFNHGFTTRRDGHGFGLHSAALAIEEACGSIEAQSPGVGQGATFLVSIPVEMPVAAQLV